MTVLQPTLVWCKKNKELEIWGKAQRESARRLKSDWWEIGGVVNFPQHQSHVART